MNAFLDDFLVGLALLGGFGYALCSLGPKSLRARVLSAAATLVSRVPAAVARSVAQRLVAAAGRAKAACGGCDNCGSNAAAPRPDAGKAAPEVKIPLSKIGRRRVH